jgi:hypothetical protein
MVWLKSLENFSPSAPRHACRGASGKAFPSTAMSTCVSARPLSSGHHFRKSPGSHRWEIGSADIARRFQLHNCGTGMSKATSKWSPAENFRACRPGISGKHVGAKRCRQMPAEQCRKCSGGTISCRNHRRIPEPRFSETLSWTAPDNGRAGEFPKMLAKDSPKTPALTFSENLSRTILAGQPRTMVGLRGFGESPVSVFRNPQREILRGCPAEIARAEIVGEPQGRGFRRISVRQVLDMHVERTCSWAENA